MAETKNSTQTFYVGLKEPRELRRQLLESSKGLIQLLQKYEHFKSASAEKEAQTERLKKILTDISMLVNRLKAALPKGIPSLGRIPGQVKTPKTRGKAANTTDVPKDRKEISKLEEELREIESKLDKLA